MPTATHQQRSGKAAAAPAAATAGVGGAGRGREAQPAAGGVFDRLQLLRERRGREWDEGEAGADEGGRVWPKRHQHGLQQAQEQVEQQQQEAHQHQHHEQQQPKAQQQAGDSKALGSDGIAADKQTSMDVDGPGAASSAAAAAAGTTGLTNGHTRVTQGDTRAGGTASALNGALLQRVVALASRSLQQGAWKECCEHAAAAIGLDTGSKVGGLGLVRCDVQGMGQRVASLT